MRRSVAVPQVHSNKALVYRKEEPVHDDSRCYGKVYVRGVRVVIGSSVNIINYVNSRTPIDH